MVYLKLTVSPRYSCLSKILATNDGIKQSERLIRLNKIAISQMEILTETNKKLLKG